jgi:hypothetical protein
MDSAEGGKAQFIGEMYYLLRLGSAVDTTFVGEAFMMVFGTGSSVARSPRALTHNTHRRSAKMAWALLLSAAVSVAGAVDAGAAVTAAQKCLASKLKEMGKYDNCRLKAEAKAVLKQAPPDYSKCTNKLSTKWPAIEAKANGECPTIGDQPALQSESDNHTDTVVALLTPPPPSCVDGTLDLGEQCDGADLNGWTCQSLGAGDSGVLACDGSCQLDTSGCVQLCGNGVIDGFEECDGTNFGGHDCTYYGGTGGTLACEPGCYVDTSGCTTNCGNGVREPLEECDMSDFGGQTCTDLGFEGGSLACTVDCKPDTSGCTTTCGDNMVDYAGGEMCDGTDLGFATDCTSFGYHSGSLSCDGSCQYDTSGCVADCSYSAQDCPAGQGCYPLLGCADAGTGTRYDACVAQNDCQAGYICASNGIGNYCLQICNVTHGDADCTDGGQCLGGGAAVDPNLGLCYGS